MNTFREIAHLHPSFLRLSGSSLEVPGPLLGKIREMKASEPYRADQIASEVLSEYRYLLSIEMRGLDEECAGPS